MRLTLNFAISRLHLRFMYIGSTLMVALCLSSLSSLSLANTSADNRWVDETLPNGVRVIIKPDHRAPTVSHTVWYRVGSIDEYNGITGISHMLEHMMFKGTASVPDGEFSKRVAAVGGRDNAFTSYDNTVYFQLIPKDALPSMMALEADRMVNLVINPEAFAKEQKVVIEERRLRTEDNPSSLFWERMMATRFVAHPYHHPVIGWMNDIERYSVEDLRQWYQRHYAPDNATVIIVGDVHPEQTLDKARAIYGAVKLPLANPESAQQRRDRKEPPQDDLPPHGLQRLNFRAAVHQSELIVSYKAPSLRRLSAEPTPEERRPFALDMVAMILDGHNGARLPQRLIREQQIAADINVYYQMIQRGAGQWLLSANAREGVSLSRLETAVRRELQRIAQVGVSAPELARAKRQLLAQSVYRRDSLFGQAMEIGRLAMNGFAPDSADTIDRVMQSITAEEIQTAAQSLFHDDALLIGTLVPSGEKPQAVKAWSGR